MVTDKTVFFNQDKEDKETLKLNRKKELKEIYQALVEKGYNPTNQMVGYILSGDPTYITNHKDARAKIASIDRDELVEDMIRKYLEI